MEIYPTEWFSSTSMCEFGLQLISLSLSLSVRCTCTPYLVDVVCSLLSLWSIARNVGETRHETEANAAPRVKDTIGAGVNVSVVCGARSRNSPLFTIPSSNVWTSKGRPKGFLLLLCQLSTTTSCQEARVLLLLLFWPSAVTTIELMSMIR